jgi:hypothetical protein
VYDGRPVLVDALALPAVAISEVCTEVCTRRDFLAIPSRMAQTKPRG